ncbi:signal peptidase I [Patescibacteria group bacterium]
MDRSFFAYINRIFKLVVIIVFVILITRAFVVEPGRVNGRSMEPTYYDEEVFLVNKYSLLFTPPHRGMVVQFFDETSTDLVLKRVIGLPGETVEIRGDNVYITDEEGTTFNLYEPYLAKKIIGYKPVCNIESGEISVIPEHSYFVMGDNRDYSTDSRHFGPIHRSFINGLVMDVPFF